MKDKKVESIHYKKCAKCSKMITSSVVHSVEGADYILHFCGRECYDHQIKHHEKKDDTKLINKKDVFIL
jgi:hypothetical protein